jgi:membrane protein implicated in regulation of membrane protease activity
MQDYQLLTLIFSALGLLLIPAMVVLIRGAAKWAHMESKVDELARTQQEMAGELRQVTTAIQDGSRGRHGRG